MAALSHVKSNSIGDFTGTVTVFNSQGSTQTANATDLVRPGDWNSAHNFFQTISGNTFGSSTASGTNLVIGGDLGARVGMSTGANAATLWVQPPIMSGVIEPVVDREFLAAQIGQNQLFVQPLVLRAPAQFEEAVQFVNYSNATNSSNSATLTLQIGFYTRTGNTLSSVTSASASFAVTNSGTVGSYSIYAGMREMAIPLTTTLSAGNWHVVFRSQTTTGGGAGMTFSNFVASNINSAYSGRWSSANNATNQFVMGLGSYSATSTAMPASIALSQINGSAAANMRPVIFKLVSSDLN